MALRRQAAIALAVATFASAGPLAAGLAAAEVDGRCTIRQVTHTGTQQAGGGSLSLSADGSRMAFASRANLTGQNPDHRIKVFLYDIFQDSLAQVPPSPTALGGDPAISADGSTIVYAAGGIIHHDIGTGSRTELTPPGTHNGAPAISADGTDVVYLHDTSSTGFGPYEVIVADLAASTTTTIATGVGLGRWDSEISPDIAPDGSTVAYLGDHDPTGANPDGSLEIFVHDRATNTTIQITSTLGSMGAPRFIENGTKVVFMSDEEFAGPNPGGRSHWFVYDLATAGITRMTDLGAEGRISEDGSRIAFVDRGNVGGANPLRTGELFSYNVTTAELTQLTASADPVYDNTVAHAQSADGTTIAFDSFADPTGANPDHSPELFLATTCGPPPRPDAAIATARTGPYAGDDVYSATATSTQKQVATIGARQTRKFFVDIQNDRAIPDSFTIHGAVAGSPGYQVRYLDERTDVTAAVQAGTYQIGPLEPGETATLKVKITATTATAGSGRRVDLTAHSITNPVTPDTVRARVVRT